jgi:hypothetical protein
VQLSQFDEAVQALEKASVSTTNTLVLASRGRAKARAGDRQGALEILDEMREMSKQTYVPAFDFAVLWRHL